jgi:2-polyprenyl-3-methyl-5-hydroxy-6-metoxy-1,4-benzoquinol methylase
MNQQKIRQLLSVIRRAAAMIEAEMETDGVLILDKMLEQPAISTEKSVDVLPAEIVTVANAQVLAEETKRHIEERKDHVRRLMEIDCWPSSIGASLFGKEPSERDQSHRAKAVIDMMIDRVPEGCRFLDYGCGEGWIAREALRQGVFESWAYDIKSYEQWDRWRSEGVRCTANRSDLPGRQSFDLVILYDVLDHCENPLEIMAHVGSLVKKTGQVCVRCHPWTSRHATHLCRQGINKAYLHLFLSYEELKEITHQEPFFTRPEKKPVEAYHWWFKDFQIKKEFAINEAVSEFFHVPAFKELLANEQRIPISEIDAFLKSMETQFINYTLIPK